MIINKKYSHKLMYKIQPYSFAKADELGVYIKPSTKKNKKIDVFDGNHQYILSIGDQRYNDYPTYIKTRGYEYANERRRLYHLRHKKYEWGSKGFYSSEILW